MGVKITVLICCFNGERFLKRALESLIGQKVKLRDFEVLFVDDGSTDCSHEIAKRFEKRLPLRIYKNSKIGAGSVITRDVPANTLAVERSKLIISKKS